MMVAFVALAAVVAIGVGRVGTAAALRAKADAAADAAALAAADALALGKPPPAARADAAAIARANGAHLVRCDCHDVTADVTVTVDPPHGFGRRATGYARAEVDIGRAFALP